MLIIFHSSGTRKPSSKLLIISSRTLKTKTVSRPELVRNSSIRRKEFFFRSGSCWVCVLCAALRDWDLYDISKRLQKDFINPQVPLRSFGPPLVSDGLSMGIYSYAKLGIGMVRPPMATRENGSSSSLVVATCRSFFYTHHIHWVRFDDPHVPPLRYQWLLSRRLLESIHYMRNPGRSISKTLWWRKHRFFVDEIPEKFPEI